MCVTCSKRERRGQRRPIELVSAKRFGYEAPVYSRQLYLLSIYIAHDDIHHIILLLYIVQYNATKTKHAFFVKT